MIETPEPDLREQAQRAGSLSMTGSVATRVLGVVAIAAVGVMALLALWISPADAVQGDAVRLMYVHVPSIWVAYGGFVLTAFASARVLWRTRSGVGGTYGVIADRQARRWDRVAGAAAELGVLFTALTLVTGSLWGKVTWGTYWQWDARLTTTVLLFVTYLGYLALRRLPAESRARARRSAVMALIAVVNLPIVHYSVDWWRTLHQEASLNLEPGGDRNITGEMYWTLLYSWATFTVVALWIGIHRYRVLRLEELAEEASLEELLAQRRDEQAAGR
ncbi:MAG: cytochrome C biogenesis protein [Acidimicrobiales bacterium]|nr:cytochrome C biogenesis protein [Acidimicrobiales bacterium]MYA26915.1 cytochrome C biogenesis protein [Acidimicrobiales bacterium]MYA83648.1 cytochrome C biogenesis protein [Acidimicrobiales bacterium]MYD33065.1 cytochrome C biogenesis protein [Acidimicrobiales bacterium]MYD83026.1 cytochrome C biogenesis protein [Acidimicrobiales bacterium]